MCMHVQIHVDYEDIELKQVSKLHTFIQVYTKLCKCAHVRKCKYSISKHENLLSSIHTHTLTYSHGINTNQHVHYHCQGMFV
jgi:hypothetical protein